MLFLPISIAETQIFSDKVITGSDKSIGGFFFRFIYDDSSNKTFVQTPSQNLIVEKGKCGSNNLFRVCINSADYYDKNVTTYVYYYQLDVTVYKLTGSLSTATRAKSSTLLPRESTDWAITITNPTDFDITNIRYTQDLSPFSILESSGCDLNGARISWRGSLNSKYDKTCTAKIAAEKDGTYSLAGNLDYFNSYETENITTDTVAITVLPKQLKMAEIFDRNVEVMQPFYINATLQNMNNEERIELHGTIELPSNMALLKNVDGFTKNSNILRIDSVLDPGATIGYSLYLEASSESAAPVKDKFDYIVKGISDAIENDTFINPAEPKPIINFSSEYSEIAPGQKFIVIAKLANPSKVHQLTGIKATLNAPYNNPIEQKLSRLLPGDSYSIISSTLSMPQNMEAGGNRTIALNLTVEYNFYEDARSMNRTLELKIKPANASNSAADSTNRTIQDTKSKDAAEPTSKTGNKTSTPAAAIAAKPKSGFFNKNTILLGTITSIMFLVILFIIGRARKGKKGSLEEKALNEISDALNKPS